MKCHGDSKFCKGLESDCSGGLEQEIVSVKQNHFEPEPYIISH